MPRPKLNPETPSVANSSEIALAIAHGEKDFELLAKEKHLTWSATSKAVDLLRTLNPRRAVPAAVTRYLASLEAAGRRGGIRGRVPPKVGETRDYVINNHNMAKNEPVDPTIRVPLSLYPGTDKEGAKAHVSFEKNRVVITF